jgi:hypothetical protein
MTEASSENKFDFSQVQDTRLIDYWRELNKNRARNGLEPLGLGAAWRLIMRPHIEEVRTIIIVGKRDPVAITPPVTATILVDPTISSNP